MKSKRTLISLLLTAVAVSTLAAEDTAPTKGDKRQKLDPETLFARMDTDGNGVIDKQEFLDGQKKMQQLRSEKTKNKGQGQAQKAEASSEEFLKKYDTNGDGVLSKKEKKAMLAEHSESRGAEE